MTKAEYIAVLTPLVNATSGRAEICGLQDINGLSPAEQVRANQEYQPLKDLDWALKAALAAAHRMIEA